MSNIEKIKAYIERQMDFIEGLFIEGDASFYDGQDDAYNHLLAFINSLPEENPSEDLEEAAEISFDEARALTEDYRDFLAKGLTENRPRPIGPHWFCEYAKNRFIAGAEWMRKKDVEDMYMSDNRHFLKCYEQGKVDMKVEMMKDAVEGEIVKDITNKLAVTAKNINLDGFKFGDKVKIIIVKQDE